MKMQDPPELRGFRAGLGPNSPEQEDILATLRYTWFWSTLQQFVRHRPRLSPSEAV
jgi:hypothetical protein